MELTKVCLKCKKELSLDNFSKNKSYKDGLVGKCKGCIREYDRARHIANLERAHTVSKKWYEANSEKAKAASRAYCAANPEQAKAATRAWRKTNSEKHRAKQKEWRESNTEQIKAASKKWYEANSEKHSVAARMWREANLDQTKATAKMWQEANHGKTRQYVQHRNATKRSLLSTLTVTQWEVIKQHFNNACCYCGEEKPLHQEHFVPLSKNGEYTANNIICACKSCNSSKKNNTFNEWYPKFKHYTKKREQMILSFLNYSNNIQQLALF